jgi:hypothetical protein
MVHGCRFVGKGRVLTRLRECGTVLAGVKA